MQSLPRRDGIRLSTALNRLGRNPRDVSALIEAGDAALDMGDADAASGFFKRADQLSPNNPGALGGLAGAMVRANDPLNAIAMSDRARQAGADEATLAADRGLAYDLIGVSARAQDAYRVALAREPDAEVTRRLAVSQAISGNGEGAEATLMPLLRAQDKAAWRARVFIFAILGQPNDAADYARRLLPADLAAAMTPYLVYMPKLTRAQQAAAANLGVFPRAADIGLDDPRLAAYAANLGARPRLAAADKSLVPAGEPLGRRRSIREQRAARAAEVAARTAPPDPLPTREIEVAVAELGAKAPAAALAVRPAPVRTSVPVAITRVPGLGPARSSSVGMAPPRITMPAAPLAAGRATTLTVPDVAGIGEGLAPRTTRPALPSQPPPSLADAFSDLGAPSDAIAPTLGAVDITRLTPPRVRAPAPLAAAKPAPAKLPPSHPSRIWVQLGVGRDKQALVWDWRKLAHQAPDLFKAHKPFSSEWGQTNRMLTGPFETEAAASDFASALRKSGVVGPFAWVSPAGQVVDSLAER